MLRSNLLFVHVIATMGIFLALGVEAMVLGQLRRAADAATARAALAWYGAVQRVAGPSMLLLLVTGLYLARAYWQFRGAWMGLGLLGLLMVGILGGLMTGRNMRRLRKALESGGEIAAIGNAHRTFRTSLALRCALLTIVVYLMTVKPG